LTLSLVVGSGRQIHLGHLGPCQRVAVWPQHCCCPYISPTSQLHFSSDIISNFQSLLAKLKDWSSIWHVYLDNISQCCMPITSPLYTLKIELTAVINVAVNHLKG